MNFESVLLYNKFYLIKKDNFGRVLLDRGDNLKNKIEILIKDKKLRKELGNNNRKLAEEKFDRKKTYNQIVKIIEGN